ncbi:hypothetical protein QQ020_05780 [Fulvivirgaceae bacterium BMA12]|uniref:Porin n=1 Tax=Agaribacillus aureus TaxID=3051825 RepID=A0ABT8L3D0_9BACT|nr:hypothetical protein [Fulvivirgaceae bacterium BMA12]
MINNVYKHILLKKALLVVVWLLGSYTSEAQINIDSLSKESPYGPFTTRFFTEKQIKYGDTTKHFLDTLPDNFQRFDQVSINDYRYQNLGNLGTSLRPIFYEAPKIIGKTSGFSSYNPYFKSPDEIKYYNTKSPYSSIKSVFGGEGRSVVDVQFSRNINPLWNVGFDVTTINADKQVNSSGDGDRNSISWAYDLYSSFSTPDNKYHVLANFSRLRHRVTESGGIIPPEVDPTSNLFGYNDDAKIWLLNAESSKLLINYHVYHHYQLNSLFQIYHILDRTKEVNKFEDDNLAGDGDFFTDFLISPTSTFDRSELKVFTNELGVKGDYNNLFYSFYVKRRSLNYVHKYLENEGIENEDYAGTYLIYRLSDSMSVNFEGEVLTDGNFKIQADFNSKWLNLGFNVNQHAPSFLVDNYFGNHYEWDNNFSSVNSETFKGAINVDLGKLLIRPTASFTTLNDYIYFNSQKRPAQAVGKITIFSPGLDLNLTFLKHMHMDSRFTYTRLGGSDQDKMRIPEIHANSKLYYENILFNKVMWAQVGFDMHWQSAYFAPDYDPVTQQFFLQNDFEIPSYLLADLFVSFKVKRIRWFFKMTNVLQNVEADGYFTTPYYTGQKRTFDFGVNWMFFD